MAEESFRDPAVAAALNAGFVAVLVDREGRPELADAYARTAAAMGERVGFPLHVFLLPDGSPFHAATFLPRRDEPGRPGILSVLGSVERALASGAAPLAARGSELRARVARELEVTAPEKGALPGAAALLGVVHAVREASDPEFGGRRALPKRTADLDVPLLLRHQRRSGDRRSLALAVTTLERMAAGPVRAAAGGFADGAAARDWSDPRADQRLADNALLALSYLEGAQATGRDDFRDVARGSLDFLLTALRAPAGGFIASTGAAGRDAQRLAGANGLALSALARGGFVLAEPRYLDAARETARFALARLRGADGLAALVADGRRGAPASLADHALLIAGFLDLLEADPDPAWLDAALALAAEQEARFAAPEGGYFLTAGAPGPGLPRPRHARDGLLPSGVAVAALNGLRLHALTGERAHLARADAVFAAFGPGLAREPLAHETLALALDARLDGLHEVVLVTQPDAEAPLLTEVLRSAFVPNRVLIVAAGAAPGLERARLLAGKRALDGRSTAFVCRDQVCTSPARDADTLAAQLARSTPLAVLED
jgi:hypothetical protein